MGNGFKGIDFDWCGALSDWCLMSSSTTWTSYKSLA